MKNNNSNYKKAFLVFPQVQYYLYLVPLYNGGHISSAQFLKWAESVDQRIKKVSNAIEKRLDLDLDILESPLATIKHYVLETILSNEQLSLESIKNFLSSTSEIWKLVLIHISVTDWNQLINTSYVVAFLGQSLNSEENEQLVHIDDPIEKVILNELSRVRKKLKKKIEFTSPTIFGIYPLQNIVLNNQEKDSNLYHMDGNPKTIREVVNLYHPRYESVLM